MDSPCLCYDVSWEKFQHIPGIQSAGSYLEINGSAGCSDLSLVSVRWYETLVGRLVYVRVFLTLRLPLGRPRLLCYGKLRLSAGRWRNVGKFPPQADLDVAGRVSVGACQVKHTWGSERESEKDITHNFVHTCYFVCLLPGQNGCKYFYLWAHVKE